MMSDHVYKVSVRLMTFNHGKYIKKALDGIMIQKTNFLVQVVIGDDFSSDNTSDIIKQYKAQKNITIDYLERKKGDSYWTQRQRKGRLFNFVNILDNCKGRFIALLDGDDYWTDPYKLQKQVDFMEANPAMAFSFHGAKILNENTGQITDYYRHQSHQDRAIVPKKYFVREGYCTASAMFRHGVVADIPHWFTDAPVGDFPLALLAIKHGEIGYLADQMAVYRQFAKGSWTNSMDSFERFKSNFEGITKVLNHFNEDTSYKFKDVLDFNDNARYYRYTINFFQSDASKLLKLKFWLQHTYYMSPINSAKSFVKLLRS